MPTPAWCSTRWRGSSRPSPPRRKKAFSAKQACRAAAGLGAAGGEPSPREATRGLTEALAAIRSAVEAAQPSAVEALDGLALEQQLAPVRKGARVIREIAWRLREIGNDGRICDLIDSQVGVIEAGARSRSRPTRRKARCSAAFA